MCTSSERGLTVFHFRGIHVDYKRCLVGIDHTKKEATFKKMDSDTGETEKCQVKCKYFLTHQFKNMFWVLKRTVSFRRFF